MERLTMTKYIVNNQEVEYLHITEKHDGTIEVHYEEKFNILHAHHSEIMKRLREDGIHGCHVFNYEIKYKIIIIMMKRIDQLTGILHALDIPYGCYEVNYEDAEIIIDTPDYDRLVTGVNTVKTDDDVCEELI